jgi:acetyl esterase
VPPTSIELEPVAPEVTTEVRAFNQQLEALIASRPMMSTFPASLIRSARRAGKGVFPPPIWLPHLHDRELPSRQEGRSIRVRIARPASGSPRGMYLHLHSGGWTLGAADLQDPYLDALATATELVVVSVDYRLAPEHPYPAGPDDCEDVARWLLTAGSRELAAPPECSIGGESAGAHLSAVTLVRLGTLASRFRAVSFMFGAFDLSMTPSHRAWGARDLVLSGPTLEYFGGGFTAGRSLEQRRVPDISPLYADLAGLPAALFSVGTVDPLLDDTLFMAARWRAAGNQAELKIWPDAIHGFTMFDLEIARLANAAQFAFLARAHSR